MNKTIAIVGAGPGLGLSIAKRFGREGFQVALVARNKEKLDALVAELRSHGIAVERFAGDVTDETSLKQAFQFIEQCFGHIDVLEYSPIAIPADPAGFAELEVTAMTPAVVKHHFEIMALGAVASVQQALPEMLARGSGTIILTMGAAAKGFMPMAGAWGVAGSAVRNYARTLGNAVRGKGVHVAAVALGVFVSKDDPFGDPDRLADRYYALYQDGKSAELFINHLPPEMIELDKG
ncbi:SDR family NAD(P)-dependent oxidoreductase [Bradyrhizobium manausense]|uniref:SDR family NAD(P)-dependent oxidoreductase n=1 Tax=Bradyrhizobium manausense TaxID=989370 RepID=UPI001BAAB003|nr:SDR family NAD(P)-dependent oxidoreductase [Bradyrhizobium manausense]MBR0725523.1 SDR family NAD(P)-dependent oxidoreductase [Bradyrhizobium manausense]